MHINHIYFYGMMGGWKGESLLVLYSLPLSMVLLFSPFIHSLAHTHTHTLTSPCHTTSQWVKKKEYIFHCYFIAFYFYKYISVCVCVALNQIIWRQAQCCWWGWWWWRKGWRGRGSECVKPALILLPFMDQVACCLLLLLLFGERLAQLLA